MHAFINVKVKGNYQPKMLFIILHCKIFLFVFTFQCLSHFVWSFVSLNSYILLLQSTIAIQSMFLSQQSLCNILWYFRVIHQKVDSVHSFVVWLFQKLNCLPTVGMFNFILKHINKIYKRVERARYLLNICVILFEIVSISKETY